MVHNWWFRQATWHHAVTSQLSEQQNRKCSLVVGENISVHVLWARFALSWLNWFTRLCWLPPDSLWPEMSVHTPTATRAETWASQIISINLILTLSHATLPVVSWEPGIQWFLGIYWSTSQELSVDTVSCFSLKPGRDAWAVGRISIDVDSWFNTSKEVSGFVNFNMHYITFLHTPNSTRHVFPGQYLTHCFSLLQCKVIMVVSQSLIVCKLIASNIEYLKWLIINHRPIVLLHTQLFSCIIYYVQRCFKIF